MKPFNRRVKRMQRGTMAALLAGLVLTAAADQAVVHKSVDVLADKNPFADPVETVASNTSLEKLGTEGSWVKVRTPAGKVGYVTNDDFGLAANLTGLSANDQASAAIATNASRGLDNDAQEFVRQKNLRLDGYNAMINTGNSVTRTDVRNFAKEGHVGPANYRNKNQ